MTICVVAIGSTVAGYFLLRTQETMWQQVLLEATRHKPAEETLTREQKLMRALIDLLPDCMYVKDAQSRFLVANLGLARLIGVKDPKDALGKTDFDFFPPDLAAQFRSDEERLLHSGQALINHEEPLCDSSGRTRWMLTTKTQLHNELGEVTGLVGISRDITDQKMTQEELSLAKSAAELASRAKSEFLANMSHEIRTPMNGVIGMTELALDTDLSPEQREYLDMVKESADSLLTIINDILDFSKIEAGKFSLDFTEFELGDSLAATIKMLAPRAHLKGLELAYQVSPDVPTALVGDPSRLRQIITNLMGNAIKFTEQGEVVLRVETESRTDGEAYLHFSVSDTGIGVPPEKQQAIFEPFIQADGSMTRKYGGTGLGLAISSSLVALLGGRIWLESEAGKGSTFHFTARFGLQKVATARTTPRETINLQAMPVLVVDDNAVNRRILDAMLKHWLMKPTLTEGGQAGLAAMRENKKAGKAFPLVLLDAQMPDMDGFAVAEEIKKDPELAGATIMMLTSAGRRGDGALCREMGIAAYMVKPLRQSELLEAILAALGKPSSGADRPQVITRHSLRETRRKLHILLAEDNPINQKLTVRLIEKRDHTIVVASNGREALAALEEQSFDLVLMDVQMPEMDGFEATAAIRDREKTTGQHLPIIAMTAHAMKGDRERCLAAGMDAYVSKPIQVEGLFATIDGLISGPGGPVPGKPPSEVERRQIESRLAEEIADDLTGAFDRFCTPASSKPST
jgi:PAS domain S-box-containing protein